MATDSPHPEAAGADRIVFHARLTPQRSLSRRGLVILFAVLIAATTALSIPFYLLGALPVVGFLGLDLVLLWVAFHVSNARARTFEELILTPIELLFRRVTWRGNRFEWRFNPLWVRLSTEEHEEFGLQRIALVEGRRHVELGSFLGAEEKADFFQALRAALAAARRGPQAP